MSPRVYDLDTLSLDGKDILEGSGNFQGKSEQKEVGQWRGEGGDVVLRVSHHWLRQFSLCF